MYTYIYIFMNIYIYTFRGMKPRVQRGEIHPKPSKLRVD